jgi:hypothetical protein
VRFSISPCDMPLSNRKLRIVTPIFIAKESLHSNQSSTCWQAKTYAIPTRAAQLFQRKNLATEDAEFHTAKNTEASTRQSTLWRSSVHLSALGGLFCGPLN